MKRRRLAVIIIIIAIIILVTVFSIFNFNKNTKYEDVVKMNQIQFSFLKCISVCPLTISENKTEFKQSCFKSCIDSNKVPEEILKKYPSNQLLICPEYLSCLKLIDQTASSGYDKFQTCLINTLPKMEQKYPYLKTPIKQ